MWLWIEKGQFKCYIMQMGLGGVTFSGKKRYEGVRFNVVSVTRGWVGVKFAGGKRYVTLEWPQTGAETELCSLGYFHILVLVVSHKKYAPLESDFSFW